MSTVNGFEKWPKYEVMKKKKIKEPDDNGINIGNEELALKRKKIKPAKTMKQSGRGRPKQLTKSHGDCYETNSNHESPKIWELFERFQNFSKRKLLTRTKSGLLDPSEAIPEKIPNDTEIMANEKNIIDEDNATNRSVKINNATSKAVIEKLLPKQAELLTGGNRKRKLAEIVDYDEGQPDGKRVAQPASNFKPKCLNFYEIDDTIVEVPSRVDAKDKVDDVNNFEIKESTSNNLKTKRMQKRK